MATAIRAADILVVDDDDDLREALTEFFHECGFSVAGAAHGQLALDWMRKNGLPGLVLLDMRMPIMDGAAFRQEQLRDPGLRDVPVFLFTATAGQEVVDAINPLRVFRKPPDSEELLSAVRSVLQ